MAHGSYYDVLGVDQQASSDQIKAAYQKLVLTLHPDKAGEESQERFQLLQQAWQVSSSCYQPMDSTSLTPSSSTAPV
jgi:DnaJ-class molecular chaperone